MMNQNKTYSMIPSNDSADHVEYGLNNSADNLEPITDDKKIIENKKKMSTSCYNKNNDEKIYKEKYKNINLNKIQRNTVMGLTSNANSVSNTQDPRILKIIKKNKK